MSEFPRFEFSVKEVRRAGEVLAGTVVWTPESEEEARHVFRVANSWRDSHAYPMRSLRYELIAKIRREKLKGLTVARLKRMPSIRKKLGSLSGNLSQIQDLAGCRALVGSISDVSTLARAMRQEGHDLHREDDYIAKPKPDGYRSHHLVFKFQGVGEAEVYNNRRVEIQIRTHVQHSWATAVEAVGLFRGENMKAGEGDPAWLRLFVLMSAELALAEGCGEPVATPRRERVSEIKELNKKLRAAETLEDLRHAVHFAGSRVTNVNDKPEYYLITYNKITGIVSIEPHLGAISGVTSYDRAESIDNKSGAGTTTTVLVEADDIESLIAAYPNYFGDIQMFQRVLRDITKGKDVREYSLKPSKFVTTPPKEVVDASWLRPRWYR